MAITGTATESFELGPIRPPSEAFSLLIRVTRNCPWNRCKFCPIYKGERFQLRSVEELNEDIDAAKAIYDKIKELASKYGGGNSLREVAAGVYYNPPNGSYRNVALWMYAGGKHAFLQDANTIIMKTGELAEVIKYLKMAFPDIERITSYGRSHTVARKSVDELKELREAGLSRIHIGMESGHDPVLRFLDKGTTAAEHITAGRKVMDSGISLCEYVMLGVGGKTMWRQHALETAEVLNRINPDFVRFRTLTIQPRMLLYNDVTSGAFIRMDDEEIVAEERLLLENLEGTMQIVSDHMINLLQEIEGKMPQDKGKMLAVIRRFQSLAPEERENFKLGRRLGIYSHLDDLNDDSLRRQVEGVRRRLGDEGVTDELLFGLMERYI
jgi:radical SAM superfamily enzyme YgiQ (UPF0313 family)